MPVKQKKGIDPFFWSGRMVQSEKLTDIHPSSCLGVNLLFRSKPGTMNWSVNWSKFEPKWRRTVIHFSETIPASQAKTHFSSLLKRIREQHESFAISQRGKIEGVLLGIDEYESLIETLEILSDRELMISIDRGLSDEKTKKLYSHEEVFKK